MSGLKDKLGKVLNEAKEKAEDLKDAAEVVFDEVKDKAEDVAAKVKVDELRDKAEDFVADARVKAVVMANKAEQAAKDALEKAKSLKK